MPFKKGTNATEFENGLLENGGTRWQVIIKGDQSFTAHLRNGFKFGTLSSGDGEHRILERMPAQEIEELLDRTIIS